jgi:glycosyltransferase involved in cell wall biosynthesis
MRVRFDEQIFSLQVRGGISRYFTELIRLFRNDRELGVQPSGGSLWTANQHLLESGLGRRLPTRAGRHRSVLQVANRLRRDPVTPDVVHHTYYVDGFLKITGSMTRVVTVYDMIPELFPELFRGSNPHLAKKTFVEQADLILCISEATRRDLVQVYGKPSAPVVVTPLGVHQNFRPGTRPLISLPQQYVLFVGNRSAYKDFAVLVEAFAGLRDANLSLVAVGGPGFDDDEVRLFERLELANRVQHCLLDDADLARAYANALCFVFPSRHEGFGLPTLEAMSSGCPTVLCDSSSHPEVGGDAAAYFPPGDVEALRRTLGEIVADGRLRSQMVCAGLDQARRFSWERTARLTSEAYRLVATPS